MKVVFVVSILYIFLYAMYLNLSFAFGKIRDPRRDNMYLCILVVAMAVFGSSINPPSHGWDLYRHYQYLEALRTANYSFTDYMFNFDNILGGGTRSGLYGFKLYFFLMSRFKSNRLLPFVTLLYVIGNGFDLAHGVPSSYSKFRDWLGKHSNLRKTLETYIKNDALWWNLEEALADLDLDTPSMAIPEMLDAFDAYDPDAQMADYYAAIDMAMLPVDTITNELPKKFRRWIESLKVDSSVKPLSGLVKPGAKYLDFNYTEFAETLYGAKGVCYIHGSRKNRKAKLILGHSYKKYVSDVSVKMPRFKDGFKRGMVNAAFDDAMVHAGWYDQATTKNSRQIIKEHEGFFDGLSDIDTVIVIGHSLSEVDMEYFEKICSEIHSDAKWIFSCHDSAGLKAINAFVKTMAIGADRVTLFRL